MSFIAPSELLVFFFFFDIDRLDVIYTGPDRSFIAPSGLFFFFDIDRLDVIYTEPDMSFIASSELFIIIFFI